MYAQFTFLAFSIHYDIVLGPTQFYKKDHDSVMF